MIWQQTNIKNDEKKEQENKIKDMLTQSKIKIFSSNLVCLYKRSIWAIKFDVRKVKEKSRMNLSVRLYTHTYIIGHYKPSKRITA